MYVRAEMQAAKTLVVCPDMECHAILAHMELKAILGSQQLALLQQRSLEQATAIDPTLHLCRTPDCKFVVP